MPDAEQPTAADSSQPRDAPPPRRSALRRIARILLILLLAILIPIVIGLVLLHTPPGRRTVQAFLEKTVGQSVAGQLHFGNLDYNLLEGTIDAAAVKLTMEGTAVDLGEAHVRWSPGGGLRLRLVRPNIVVRDTGKPKPIATAVGMAARPWTALEKLQGAEMVDGRIEMQDANGVAYLVLGKIDAEMRVHKGRRPIQLAVRDGVVGPPEHQLSPIRGNADLTVAEGRLAFDAVHLEARDSRIDLQGVLDRISPNQGSVDLVANADGALAALAAPETKVTGRIKAEAHVLAKDTMSGTLRLSAPELTVQDIGPWDASLRGRFDSSHLNIEWAEAVGYGGRLTVNGPVALADHSKTDLVLKAENVDLAALAKAAAQTELPLRSRLDAQVRYTLQGWDVNQGRAEGQVTLAPLPALPPRKRRVAGIPVRARTLVVAEGRSVRLRELRVEAHNGLVVGELAVSPDLDISGRYRAELPLTSVPAFFADMGMQPPASPLVGRVSAEGAIGGKAKDPVATIHLQGEGIATEATARTATASIDGHARYRGARLAIDPLLVRSSGGGQATFKGSVPVTPQGGRWNIEGIVDSLDLGPMLAIAGVDGRGPLNGRITIEGPQAKPAARAELDAQLTFTGSEQPVTVSLAGSGTATRLSVDRLTAQIAGGTVEGSGSYEPRTEAIQARLTADGLQFGQLPMLPPYAHSTKGVIAVNLSLNGTAERPAGEMRGSLTQASVDGSPVPSLLLTARADGRRMELAGASATGTTPVENGTSFLRGNGSLDGNWPLHVEIDAAALPLQALLDAFPATKQQAVTLTAGGRLLIDAPLRAPREARYASDGLQASGKVREIEWTVPPFAIEGNAEEATIRGLELSASGRVPALPITSGSGVAGSATTSTAGSGVAGAAPRSATGADARDESGAKQADERTGLDAETAQQQGTLPPGPAASASASREDKSQQKLARRGRERGATSAAAGAEGMVTASGTLSIDGRVPIAAERPFDLAVQGKLDLGLLQALLPDQRVGGTADLDARLRGTAAAPDVRGQMKFSDVRGRFGAARLNDVQALARFNGDHVAIERFDGRLLGGRLAAGGTLALRKLSGRDPARFHFEATDVDLSRISSPGTMRDPDAPAFFVSISGDLEATEPTAAGVRGRGRFTRLEQQSPEGTIGLQAPAEWTLEKGRFVQQPLRLAGPLGTLEARAEAQLTGNAPGGSAVIAGPFDLRMLNPFVQDTTLAGPARIDLRANWNPKGVRMEGGLSVEKGRMTLEQLAFTANQINGQVRLLGDRATIDATASASDGTIKLGGGMTFGPSLVGPGELRIDAERVPINYPEGFRARATGTVRVAGNAKGYSVVGDIGLTQAYYTAEFSQQKDSLDRLDWQLAALRGQESITENLPLGVRIHFDDPLRIRNSQAQFDITGTINTSGTIAQPVATGALTLLEGGQLTVRRAHIRPQQGRVELNGYPGGTPEVDFSGLTVVSGIEMDLRARGSMDDLQLTITSPNRPDLSQTDLISLLLWGRTAQAAATESGAIVAEELASALGGALQKGVGETLLVDVAPERSLLDQSNDPTQRFNVGTRLRQDLIVLYSTRLDGTDQQWIVDFNPRSRSLRFRLISDASQGVSYEVSNRQSFNVFRGRAVVKPKQENPKVVSLVFRGELPLPEERLRKASGIRLGHRYDALSRERSADKVRELLVKAGWRSASVDASWRTAEGHQQSLELVLKVDAGPQVLISWTGDDPGKKIRDEARRAWPAYASPEAAAGMVARAARAALRASGYYDAKIQHQVRVEDGRAELALTVERGPHGNGIDVAFDGNTVLSDDQLLDLLPKVGSKEFFEGLEGRSDRITGEVRLAYARAGYLRVRIAPPRQAFDAASGRLRVTIPVRERGPSRVSEVVLPEEVTEGGTGGPTLTLTAGQPFDVTRYLADRDAIASWYRREGWTEARVRGVLEPTGDDVVVSYLAMPGPRPRVNEVRVATDGRPKASLLRRSVVLDPGELITPNELARSRERLSELAIFRSVDVRPVSIGDRDDLRDVVVTYVERPDVDLEYGVRWTPQGTSSVGGAPSTPDNGKIQLAGAAEISDPFGWGWRIRPYTFLMTNRYTWGVAAQAATFFGRRVRTQLQAFDDQDNRSQDVALLAGRVRGYTIQQSRALLRDQQAQRWHDRLRLQWGYANKDIRYSPLIAGQLSGIEPPDPLPAPNDRVAGNRAYLTVGLVGDERDSFTDPHRGLFWTATSELARTGLGSDVDYVRLYGQAFLYLPLPMKMVWAQGYRAGIVPGANPLLLLENRFQAGGPTTVRGFNQNDLGPQVDGEGLGGQAVTIFNQELRFPIWKQVQGGVFWDAGNVWLLSRDFALGDLRQSVGAGLRVMFPFGPLRVEYAFVLNPKDGERKGRLVFGLGHAF